MNFMATPETGITINQELKGAALDNTIKFTNKLVTMGVPWKDGDVLNNYHFYPKTSATCRILINCGWQVRRSE